MDTRSIGTQGGEGGREGGRSPTLKEGWMCRELKIKGKVGVKGGGETEKEIFAECRADMEKVVKGLESVQRCR